MVKFFAKIGAVVFFFYLLGFYFGDFNIGFINVKAKMRGMCTCKILIEAEREFYKIRNLAKAQYKKVNTHGVGE